MNEVHIFLGEVLSVLSLREVFDDFSHAGFSTFLSQNKNGNLEEFPFFIIILAEKACQLIMV